MTTDAVLVGRCGQCVFRDARGYCINPKLVEDDAPRSPDDDMLRYDYVEGGGFKVGARFGCVHHNNKEVTP